MAWTLCSKTDITSIFPVSEAALQDFWSDAVEALIREHLGAPLLGTSTVSIDGELHDGDGTNMVILNNLPIQNIVSVSVDDAPVAATEYTKKGIGVALLYSTFPIGVANVSVSYTAGSDEVDGKIIIDPIVRLCAATMISAIATYKGRGGSDASVKWASAEQKEGSTAPVLEKGLVSSLSSIMRTLLRRQRLRVR